MPYLQQPYDWNTMTGCQDCGLEYGCPEWIEAVVPNEIWAKISPTSDEGGILCITCMARRLAALGMEDVPVMLAAGVFALEPYKPHAPPEHTHADALTAIRELAEVEFENEKEFNDDLVQARPHMRQGNWLEYKAAAEACISALKAENAALERQLADAQARERAAVDVSGNMRWQFDRLREFVSAYKIEVEERPNHWTDERALASIAGSAVSDDPPQGWGKAKLAQYARGRADGESKMAWNIDGYLELIQRMFESPERYTTTAIQQQIADMEARYGMPATVQQEDSRE